MQTNLTRKTLIRELREVLPNLYNPGLIRQTWLIELFNLSRRRDAPGALRRLLSDAIQSLEPGEDCPVGSNAWRVFHVLHNRYIEQFSQEEVARDIFLSPRQVRRLEQAAVEVLADRLWAAHNLEDKVDLFSSLANESSKTRDAPPFEQEKGQPASEPSDHHEELSWLERTVSNQRVDCLELIHSALNTAHPLLESLHTRVNLAAADDLPMLSIHPTSTRQALLHVITLAAHQANDGQIAIQAKPAANRLSVHLHIHATTDKAPGANDYEGIEVAQKLVEISQGALTAETQTPFSVTFTLPTAEQITVMVVDDNLDTLHLIEHYLTSTRYRFFGMSNPTELLNAVSVSAPGAILLDVMLPEIDGWELLSRLRELPGLQQTPIIVYTILPQAELALMLGADDFLRKPIRRETLLATLDRLVGLDEQESV